MKHDTQEIRRIARQLSNLSDSISTVANGSIRDSADEIPTSFKGEAAYELTISVRGLLKDIHGTSMALEKISAMLRTYAQMLDVADDVASKLIHNK
jgi:uncharacterized protein YukE